MEKEYNFNELEQKAKEKAFNFYNNTTGIKGTPLEITDIKKFELNAKVFNWKFKITGERLITGNEII